MSKEVKQIGMALIQNLDADIIMITQTRCGKTLDVKTITKGKSTTIYKRKKE
jgi:hypothetical protein